MGNEPRLMVPGMPSIMEFERKRNFQNKKLFVISPCHNEEASICEFIDRVISLKVIDQLILIDDGSTDKTILKIIGCQEKYSKLETSTQIILLELTRNFGKESAMLAGLDYAKNKCDLLILIDSDLQHPPEKILEMITCWEKGAEIVTAVRDDRDSDSLLKEATASCFYKVFNHLVDSIKLQSGAGDFRLLSKPVISALTEMREFSRFSKGLVPWTGYKSVEVSYHHGFRYAGKSSWNALQLWRYAIDGIFSFSVIPLKVWSLIGLTTSIFSLFYAIIVIVRTAFYGVDVPGYASLIVTILFLGGIQLIGIGVLVDYIGRIYVDTKAMPHYFIRSIHYRQQK